METGCNLFISLTDVGLFDLWLLNVNAMTVPTGIRTCGGCMLLGAHFLSRELTRREVNKNCRC